MRTARSTRWRACSDRGAHLDVLGDILKERRQVDLLLVVAPERHSLLLADDREHRLAIQLRVVKTVQKMDRPGSRRRQAHAHLSGELRVPACHERRGLLVSDLDELRVAIGARQRAKEPVDSVSGVPENPMQAPPPEAFENEIGDRPGHRVLAMSLAARSAISPGWKPGTPIAGSAGSSGRATPLGASSTNSTSSPSLGCGPVQTWPASL